ncbi:MAG: permease-like cell division protein FtsX [Schleiferiaceae bacterium]|jgi:cell division transport system permease protein|nr:permease-like cell division protein FtsX [Schleiferiaceae bacterium]MDG1881925.1 permease-like cell division protein FtsX [Schleiferiaceae bacterium]|tara:strand:+ start:3520 stop:4404 length:885 start_codon:yes stop_codon:yes gene_type:complete
MSRSNREEQFNKRRLRYSYLSVIVSVGLVLFVLGVMLTLLNQARNLTDELKENFTFTLFLEPGTSESARDVFLEKWTMAPEIREIVFISKEDAASQFQDELGEDFVDFLGINPLSDALDLKLYSSFVSPKVLRQLEIRLRKESIVEDMVYDRDLISAIHNNIGKITIAMIIASIVLLLISIALINSSIRLAIYSRRFTIKTMQLVGATKAFIHKPFLFQGIKLGFIGGLFAAALLALLFQLVGQFYPELKTSLNWMLWAQEAIILATLGLFITAGSTAISVRRYLALKTNQLYE